MIGGVRVSGYVDLLDLEGRIIDSKSALKPFNGVSHDHRLQLTSYVMITPAASGACRLDTVTKGKTVNLIQKSLVFNDKDRHYAETIYPMVQESIREGSSCLGEAVHCVQDDSEVFGVYGVTAAQCVATKVTMKYPIQVPGASIGFFEGKREIASRLLRFGYVRWAATLG